MATCCLAFVCPTQINKLNVELRGYSQQLKKARGGAKKSIQMKAMQVGTEAARPCVCTRAHAGHALAYQALKRRKMYEKQREGMLATSFNMEQVRHSCVLCRPCLQSLTFPRVLCLQTNFAIQTVKDTQTTVEAMKTAAVTLREEQKKIDVDEIEVRPGGGAMCANGGA